MSSGRAVATGGRFVATAVRPVRTESGIRSFRSRKEPPRTDCTAWSRRCCRCPHFPAKVIDPFQQTKRLRSERVRKVLREILPVQPLQSGGIGKQIGFIQRLSAFRIEIEKQVGQQTVRPAGQGIDGAPQRRYLTALTDLSVETQVVRKTGGLRIAVLRANSESVACCGVIRAYSSSVRPKPVLIRSAIFRLIESALRPPAATG